MRVARRGTRARIFSSSRLNGRERACSRWPREKINSSRTSRSASSPLSASIAFRSWALMRRGAAFSIADTDRSTRRPRFHARRHPSRDVELVPRDTFEIDAGDTHEPRLGRIVDRVDATFLINSDLTRVEPIFLHRLEIGVTGGAAVLIALPLGHLRIVRRLTVYRP